MYTKRAEIKAGLTVLVSIVLLLGLLFYATGIDVPWKDRDKVFLRFTQGSVAPDIGDEVTALVPGLSFREAMEITARSVRTRCSWK